MYSRGRGVKKDFKEAVKWYRKAAEQGFAAAQYNLGLMYVNGRGVPEDIKEAVKWYRKAAAQGDAQAQGGLGVMYGLGLGVLQDYVTAYAWANIATANGNEFTPKFKSENLEKNMTADQIAKAEQLSGEMVKKNPKLLNK